MDKGEVESDKMPSMDEMVLKTRRFMDMFNIDPGQIDAQPEAMAKVFAHAEVPDHRRDDVLVEAGLKAPAGGNGTAADPDKADLNSKILRANRAGQSVSSLAAEHGLSQDEVLAIIFPAKKAAPIEPHKAPVELSPIEPQTMPPVEPQNVVELPNRFDQAVADIVPVEIPTENPDASWNAAGSGLEAAGSAESVSPVLDSPKQETVPHDVLRAVKTLSPELDRIFSMLTEILDRLDRLEVAAVQSPAVATPEPSQPKKARRKRNVTAEQREAQRQRIKELWAQGKMGRKKRVPNAGS